MKAHLLKPKLKQPKKPSEGGILSLKDAWIDKDNAKVDKLVAKKYGNDESSSSSEVSDDDSDDDFIHELKPPPYSKPIMPKKQDIKFEGLKIQVIPTKKADTPERPIMSKTILPRNGSCSLFVGASGSGKTNAFANMLINPEMYGKDKTGRPYWDNIKVFTNSRDELMDYLVEKKVLDKSDIKHNPSIKDLQKVIKNQKKFIKDSNGDWSKVPKTFIICDDFLDNDIAKSKELKTLTMRGRHLNITSFFLVQYLNSIPKAAREQMSNIFCFNSNAEESECLCEMIRPMGMKSGDFYKMLEYAWTPDEENKRPFIHIAMKAEPKLRFRKNLLNVINIDKFKKP